jgi:hypothetical protein
MPTLHLKVPLSDEAMAYLNEILTEEKGEATPSHWLFANALKPRIKETAETRKLVRARGSLELPGGKKVTPADFDIGPLESFPEGQVEFTISDRVKAWIEESAGYIVAVNQRTGGTLQWKTPAEWVREICLSAIVTRAAKLDADDLDEEEKTLYPPPEKDGRPAPKKG